MTNPKPRDDDNDLPGRHAPKKRRCLRCTTSFESEWAGERICPRCKGSNAWRTGSPAPMPPERRRR